MWVLFVWHLSVMQPVARYNDLPSCERAMLALVEHGQTRVACQKQ